jgi:hypothetical protein
MVTEGRRVGWMAPLAGQIAYTPPLSNTNMGLGGGTSGRF